MNKLSIVVVTYNEEEKILRQCFNSVYESKNVDIELFVVDNGGSALTKKIVSEYKGFKYIENSENRGFAAAVNQGMKRSTGEYILLLNPDTSFKFDVLKKMTTHLDQDKDVGVASSIIRYPDGTLQDSIRKFPTMIDQLLILFKVPHFINTRAIDKYMMKGVDPLKTQDVDSIMGAFMFIRRELINDIGLFDERYFIWFEEVDYCKMTHDAGWKIRHYGDVEITHHKGYTFSKIQTLKKQKWIRTSMRKYMRKHKGVLSAGILWALAPVFIVLAYGVALVKPK